MLFCEQINNFEDFKSRFGYKTGIDGRYLVNANGVKQRKNNVVYLYWKESCLYFKRKKNCSLKQAFENGHTYETPKSVFQDMLFSVFSSDISDICPIRSFGKYELLNHGICIDGDVSAIRYRNIETNKIYKMKIGKYVNKYLDSLQGRSRLFWLDNTTLRIFFIEELTELWKNKRLKDQTLKVVVNKDFHSIYNSSNRPADSSNFGSCMDDDDNWNYYKDHSDMYDAVSLQDEDGLIYARAILVHCFDCNDNPHKYLERIYCNKRMYKDLLFEKAKAEGIMDLYKGLEASCHDNKEIYSVETDRKIKYNLYIPICLETGDYMSYQDTFKWYYPEEERAYNYVPSDHYISLATTELEIELDD